MRVKWAALHAYRHLFSPFCPSNVLSYGWKMYLTTTVKYGVCTSRTFLLLFLLYSIFFFLFIFCCTQKKKNKKGKWSWREKRKIVSPLKVWRQLCSLCFDRLYSHVRIPNFFAKIVWKYLCNFYSFIQYIHIVRSTQTKCVLLQSRFDCVSLSMQHMSGKIWKAWHHTINYVLWLM